MQNHRLGKRLQHARPDRKAAIADAGRRGNSQSLGKTEIVHARACRSSIAIGFAPSSAPDVHYAHDGKLFCNLAGGLTIASALAIVSYFWAHPRPPGEVWGRFLGCAR